MRPKPPILLSRILGNLPRSTQIAIGILAFAVVQLFRPPNTPMFLLSLECLFYLGAPILILAAFRSSQGTSHEIKRGNRTLRFQLMGIAFTCSPLVVQIGLRAMNFGDAYEVVAIMAVLNLAWYCTILSKVANCQNVAFFLNSSVVLFVCFATQDSIVYSAAFAYSLTALWWMLENYWNRLLPTKLGAETTALPIRGLAFVCSIFILLSVGIVAIAAGPISNVIALPSLMPSSGGEQGFDDMYARSGVGDGEMLTTGDNAKSVGAVDTDQFIEGQQPSIYDVVSEKFDGPTKIRKKMTSAQSLSEIAKHIHEVKQAEQSGRTFRTVRNSQKTITRKLEDRISDALFYVTGKVPVRFRVDCFHEFDGWDWTKSQSQISTHHRPKINMEVHNGNSWFVLDFLLPKFLKGDLHHQIQILRLDSAALPSTPFIKAWHIAKVNQKNLFKWDPSNLISIRSDTIASQTVIDVISHRANLFDLRAIHPSCFRKHEDPILTQLPINANSTKIRNLADSLTQDVEPGWQQVEAITRYLKTHFELIEDAAPDDECDDTVGWFLKNGGGPSYLFATTAVELLRSAGYQTRLATGFVVKKKDYVRKLGRSIVTHENYHVWPEICFDGCHWIPVEPTPGFEEPIGYLTFWQRALILYKTLVGWVISHPFQSACVLVSTSLLCYLRRYWIAFFMWCLWKAFAWGLPSTRLRMTRQLIDARLWLFGVPRPTYIAIRDWFGKIDKNLGDEFFDCWNRMQFCESIREIIPRKQVEIACRNIVSQLSLAKIRKYGQQKND